MFFIEDKLNISSKREYSDEGFLKVPAHISRTGIQEYLASELGLTDKEPKDIIRLYRPDEEVFAKASMDSFANKPVTNNHPPELVTASNSSKYSVGLSGTDITKDGDKVKAVLHIIDGKAIKAIEDGKVELSNGYTADIQWVSGVTPDGQSYDGIQGNIKGNHIAIVERGRAGSSCRVSDNLQSPGDKPKMGKITIDGVDFEVSDQAAQAVGKLQKRLTDTEAEVEVKKKEAEDKEEEMKAKAEKESKEAKKTEDSLKAKLDDAKSKLPSAESMDKLVADRATVIDSVKTIMPDIEWQGKDADTLYAEVVTAKCPNVKMDSVSKDYIKARFDTLLEDLESNPPGNLSDDFNKQFKKDNKEVENRPADVVAREKMMADSRAAWKKKGDK